MILGGRRGQPERQQASAQLVRHSLERSLADAERALSQGRVPDAMARVTVSSSGVTVDPIERVLWVPVPAPGGVSHEGAFARGEACEFQGDDAQALARYQELARSADPAPVGTDGLRLIHSIQELPDDGVFYTSERTDLFVTINGVRHLLMFGGDTYPINVCN